MHTFMTLGNILIKIAVVNGGRSQRMYYDSQEPKYHRRERESISRLHIYNSYISTRVERMVLLPKCIASVHDFTVFALPREECLFRRQRVETRVGHTTRKFRSSFLFSTITASIVESSKGVTQNTKHQLRSQSTRIKRR